MLVFSSLKEALAAGYAVYDRTQTGYLVRIRTTAGWAFAMVDVGRSPVPQGFDSRAFDACARGGDDQC